MAIFNSVPLLSHHARHTFASFSPHTPSFFTEFMQNWGYGLQYQNEKDSIFKRTLLATMAYLRIKSNSAQLHDLI